MSPSFSTQADNEADIARAELEEQMNTKEFNTMRVLNSFYRGLKRMVKRNQRMHLFFLSFFAFLSTSSFFVACVIFT
jgi:hypothetical protein